MSTSGTQFPAHEIRPLTGRIEESVAARASQVTALIRKRRKIALTFRRTQDERDRAELEHIDRELAQHQIDIPAIQEQIARRKQGIREPVIRRAE
jgi:putative NADH-flavin reductase